MKKQVDWIGIIDYINQLEYVNTIEISRKFFPNEKTKSIIKSLIKTLKENKLIELHGYNIVDIGWKQKRHIANYKILKNIPYYLREKRKDGEYFIKVSFGLKTGFVCKKDKKTVVSFNKEMIEEYKLRFCDNLRAEIYSEVVREKIGKEFELKVVQK